MVEYALLLASTSPERLPDVAAGRSLGVGIELARPRRTRFLGLVALRIAFWAFRPSEY